MMLYLIGFPLRRPGAGFRSHFVCKNTQIRTALQYLRIYEFVPLYHTRIVRKSPPDSALAHMESIVDTMPFCVTLYHAADFFPYISTTILTYA